MEQQEPRLMEGKQETAPQCKRETLRTELEVQPEEGLRKPFRIQRLWGAGEGGSVVKRTVKEDLSLVPSTSLVQPETTGLWDPVPSSGF